MKGKKKSNAGRKKIVINWARVDSALKAGANGVQVAAMLGISFDTLSRRTNEEKNADFAAYMREKREAGNEELLKAQYEGAIGGDRGLLIWLGKQRLNQTDKKEIKQQFDGLNFKIVEDEDGN
jgi:hypothetical protein